MEVPVLPTVHSVSFYSQKGSHYSPLCQSTVHLIHITVHRVILQSIWVILQSTWVILQSIRISLRSPWCLPSVHENHLTVSVDHSAVHLDHLTAHVDHSTVSVGHLTAPFTAFFKKKLELPSPTTSIQ